MVKDVSDALVQQQGLRLRELERTLDRLREETEVMHVLLGLSAALAEVRTVEETLARAVAIVPQVFGGARAVAASWDAVAARFDIVARHPDDTGDGGDGAAEGAALAVLRESLLQRRPVLVADAAHDPRWPDVTDVGAYVAIPLIRWGEEFGALGVGYPTGRAFADRDEALARGISHQVGVALANARRFNLLESLRSFSLRIGPKLRLQAVVDEIAAGAAALLSADAAHVYFLDPYRRSLVSAREEPDEDRAPPARVDIEAPVWRGLLDGRAVWIEDASVVGAAHAVAAPIPGPETTLLGALVLAFNRSFRLDEDESDALVVLASQSGIAIENAQRFERQRRVARSLQVGLLVTDHPAVPGCEFGAVYEPATTEADVGGDFFDVVELPGERFAMVVGDVSGKGAEAAAQMAMVKYMLRAFAIREPSPSSVLYHLNNALVPGMGDDRFTTLVYALFEAGGTRAHVASAGHPPPLLFSPRAGTTRPVGRSGSILGVFEDQQYRYDSIDVAPGDVYVAYTDGLVEARRDDDLYGRRRVERSIVRNAARSATATDLARAIYADAAAFGAISDDTVVLAFRCGA